MSRLSLRFTALLILLAAVPASATITVTEKLAEAQTADNDASWTSVGTFSCADQTQCVCVVMTTASSANLTTPTLSGGSVTTWTRIGNAIGFDTAASPTKSVTYFQGVGSGASAAAITADYSGINQSSAAWNCFEVANADVSGFNGATGIVQSGSNTIDSGTSLSVTLASLGATQVVFQTMMINASGRTWTADTGFTKLTLTANATPTSEWETQYQINGTDNVPLWSISGGAQSLGTFAVEIKEAGAATGTAHLNQTVLRSGQ